MDQLVRRSRSLRGEIRIPGDKSISHRALMIAALAEGESEIRGFLNAGDTGSTAECLKSLGVRITTKNDMVVVRGEGLHGLKKAAKPLDAGNSGTTMRIMAGILSGQPFESTLSGDKYLCRRPMKRIIDPLSEMGARIHASPQFTPPLHIQGGAPLRPIEYKLPIPSAQVKSAILLAGLYASGISSVIESQPSRDHTERLLGLPVESRDGLRRISIAGGMRISPMKLAIPGDISSAAFFFVAALLVQGSDIILRNVGLNETRRAVLDILKSVGGDIEIEDERLSGGEPSGDVRVKASVLRGTIELSGSQIPLVIDEIPVLAVASAVSGGIFILTGASELRGKESDRIFLMVKNLRALGLDVDEYADGFSFEANKKLISTRIESNGDHRIAMAFGTAALALDGEMKITDAESAAISFPDFWNSLLKFQS